MKTVINWNLLHPLTVRSKKRRLNILQELELSEIERWQVTTWPDQPFQIRTKVPSEGSTGWLISHFPFSGHWPQVTVGTEAGRLTQGKCSLCRAYWGGHAAVPSPGAALGHGLRSSSYMDQTCTHPHHMGWLAAQKYPRWEQTFGFYALFNQQDRS